MAKYHHFTEAIGPRHMQATLENFTCTCNEQVAAMNLLRAYLDRLEENVRNGVNLLLYGPVGSGKDHLLAAMAKLAFRRLIEVKWKSGLDLYAAFRRAADFDSDLSEDVVLRELSDPRILIISDILPPIVPGSDKSRGVLTDYTAACLLRAIDERYRKMRPVWLTVNATGSSEMAERLGAAITDRLKDGAHCIACNWPSHRQPRK